MTILFPTQNNLKCSGWQTRWLQTISMNAVMQGYASRIWLILRFYLGRSKPYSLSSFSCFHPSIYFFQRKILTIGILLFCVLLRNLYQLIVWIWPEVFLWLVLVMSCLLQSEVRVRWNRRFNWARETYFLVDCDTLYTKQSRSWLAWLIIG